VNIQYANSDAEINGAEGVFYFEPGQSMHNLSIKVSPRYKIKDDLITSVLLSHELTHAAQYVIQQTSGSYIGCFESEAQAFEMQNWYTERLNVEERQSLAGRLRFNNSPELLSLAETYHLIPRLDGATYRDKALNFVKSNPAYQEQCSN
jgi:hypothetical protein